MWPVHDTTTTWQRPVRRLLDTSPFDLIALDDLPSLLPEEASTDFAAALLPQLAHTAATTRPSRGAVARPCFPTALPTDNDRTTERTGRE
ncbi:hypothetical protein [Streptomyces sp. NPDC058291]|uniref:hypothetical protein n=1 Tax=Streptomyces sp. NPDC058291 TaxID=3346427 RepID=UPI0036E886C2